MLEVAQKYKDILSLKFCDCVMNPRYKYYNGSSYWDEYKPTDSMWVKHEFVSVRDGTVIGYFKYGISRETYSANALQIINFESCPSITFSKDLRQFLINVFEKYGFNKLNYVCVPENPIIETYRKMTKKFGGRIVGTKKQEFLLEDGKLYNCELFEITKDEYYSNKR